MGAQSKQPPAGSKIEIVEDFDATTYRWRPPSYWLSRILAGGFCLMFPVIMLAAVIQDLVAPQANQQPAQGPDWANLIIPGIFFSILGYIAYLQLRRQRPERVTLGPSSFSCDSGTMAWPWLPFPPDPTVSVMNPNEVFYLSMRRRRKLQIAKEELDEVILERIGERQRLRFDHGADRIEIGLFLREPEREWLAAEIQAWQKT